MAKSKNSAASLLRGTAAEMPDPQFRHTTTRLRERSEEQHRELPAIYLGQGLSDLPMPKELRLSWQALCEREDINLYAPGVGLTELRQYFAEQFQRHGVSSANKDNVIITNGATGGVKAATDALLGPGDAAIVFTPGYPYYFKYIAEKEAETKDIMRLEEGDDWKLDFAAIQSTLEECDRVKLIYLANPDNPTGNVLTREEGQQLLQLANDFGVFIVLDSVYDEMVYPGPDFFHLATLPGAEEWVITMKSASKEFSMTGWRLGALHYAGDKRVLDALAGQVDSQCACSSHPVQRAFLEGVRALDLPSYHQEILLELEERRALIAEFSKVSKISIPPAAYYCLVRFENEYLKSMTADQQVVALAEQAAIATVSMTDIYPVRALQQGRTHGGEIIRLSFGVRRPEDISVALKRIEALQA